MLLVVEKTKRKYPLLVENDNNNTTGTAMCPICNQLIHGNNAVFNTHIDICMNSEAIHGMDGLIVHANEENNPLKLIYKDTNINDEWKIFKNVSDRMNGTSTKPTSSGHINKRKKENKDNKVDWSKQVVELRANSEKLRRQYNENKKSAADGDHNESVRFHDPDAVYSDHAEQPVLDVASLDCGYEHDHKVTEVKIKLTIDKKKLFGSPSEVAKSTESVDNKPQFKYDYNDYNPNRNRSVPLTESLIEVNIDSFLEEVLAMKLDPSSIDDVDAVNEAKDIPNRFIHEKHYISLFQPLLIEEVKAAMVSYIRTGRAYEQHKEKRHSINHNRDKFPSLFVNPIEHAPITDKLSELRVAKVISDVVNTSAADNSYESDVQKDDIVIILKQKIPAHIKNIEEIILLPHCLAFVHTVDTAVTTEDTKRVNRKTQFILKILGDNMPPLDKVRMIIPLTSISTFVREWTAINSIYNHVLMPLTPYILKASPTVSASFLDSKRGNIQDLLRTLGSITNTSNSLQRREAMHNKLYVQITSLNSLLVDGSVLKSTAIVKTLQSIIADKSVPKFITDATNSIIDKWKQQVKLDNNRATIASLRGGQVIQIDVRESMHCNPTCIAPNLWAKFLNTFNSTQLHAIKHVTSPSLGESQDCAIILIQGPPGTSLLASLPTLHRLISFVYFFTQGTGKSHTILGIVSSLLHRNPSDTSGRKKRLILAAPSNGAIDELLYRLCTNGVISGDNNCRFPSIVRLGTCISSDAGCEKNIVGRYSLDHQLESIITNSIEYHKLAEHNTFISGIKKMLVEAKATESKVKFNKLQTELRLHRQYKAKLEEGLERLRYNSKYNLLANADIIAGTLSSLGSRVMTDYLLQADHSFDTCIIDEAAQCTEPSTMIPLRYGCKKLVLVGDTQQLPATVLSSKANARGLGVSLFERLERAGHEKIMLNVQYRMHPMIRQFPSEYFYENKLIDAPNACHMDCSSPLILYDLMHSREESSGNSYKNEIEIDFIIKLLLTNLDGWQNQSVAVITPYKAQLHRLKQELQTNKIERVEVTTIDGFQGREKDVIIFSSVRSNRANIGFLCDHRRLNVAITRSKQQLFIIGCVQSLEINHHWNALIMSLQARNLVQTV